MRDKANTRQRTLWVPGFAVFLALAALVAVAGPRPAEAAPFAYVTSYEMSTYGLESYSASVTVIDTATVPPTVVATVWLPTGFVNESVAVSPDGKYVYVGGISLLSPDPNKSVWVIDTASNTVVATVDEGGGPQGLAVTPDGGHVYVANFYPNSVSVIDTASNAVVTTVPMASSTAGVAVTPDGKRVYVTGSGVSVIDTASNAVVATVPVASSAAGVAVTPDGKRVYVSGSRVSVIDTVTNTVVATVPVGAAGIAITPDGKRIYAAGNGVSVIDTATNTVVATVPVGSGGIAITPDGKQAYVTNAQSGVSVIDTVTNTVVATVPVAASANTVLTITNVAMMPPPAGVPFSSLTAKLEIHLRKKPNEDGFRLRSEFILGHNSQGIAPPREPVTLAIGSFTTTIPSGSFAGKDYGPFRFHGMINGVDLHVEIEPTGAKRYALEAKARDATLTETANPVPVTLTIGANSGMASVKANIDPHFARRDED